MKPIWIIGVDPGTNHFAATVSRLDGVVLTLLDQYSFSCDPSENLDKKLPLIYDAFHTFLDAIPSADILSIESQFMGRNPRTLRSLCESVGAIKLAFLDLFQEDALIRSYAPSELKIAATGMGNATKESVIGQISTRFGVDMGSDEADSVAAILAAIVLSPYIACDILDELGEHELSSWFWQWSKLNRKRQKKERGARAARRKIIHIVGEGLEYREELSGKCA
jgi:crossover junction endodeoxyribonuclease RuvC